MIECPKCGGLGGWSDMDNRWVTCEMCDGLGEIDEEDEGDDDDDE